MVTVKICGITNAEDLDAAIEAGADSLGFIVGAPSSPRNLSVHSARNLIERVPYGVDSVAVTVFRSADSLKQIFAELEPDYLQIHGEVDQTLSQISEIKDCAIVAVDGEAKNASNTATELSRFFHFILLDTGSEGGLGGTGKVHDWHISAKIRDMIHPANLILAGGLTPRNVGEAVRMVRPFGVDVSTGVEKEPGLKDHEKMREFVARAKEEET